MNMLLSAVPAHALTQSVHPTMLTVLIAVAAVFVLVAIWAIVSMLRMVRQAQGTQPLIRQAVDDTSVSSVPVASSSSADAAPVVASPSADDAATAAAIAAAIVAQESATLAAITAAIAVVWESEHPGTSFRVVSYRHVAQKPHAAWNARS